MSLSKVVHALSQQADEVIETSCATVILKGDTAYKLKKSVDFGFLDFTTPEKRRQALLRELQFNQRTAPDIYREVMEVDGEHVLVMRRFETRDVLAECSQLPDWSPSPDLMQDIGETIAQFHAGAEVCRDHGHIDNLKYVIGSNHQNMGQFRDELGNEAVAAYYREITTAFDACETTLKARFETGFVRRCHGDLHLGNILVENGKPVLFDCIEFNERLSQIDVLYDLAFLLMDLWVREHCVAANRVMNAYIETFARSGGDAGVYEGLALLPLYMSVRAGVRCHVSAHNGEFDQARTYLEAARTCLRSVPATVSAIGGLSGAGKSTHARAVAAGKGRAPGAVILRSDELRKRLWKWPLFEPLPKEAYTPEQTARTYEYMFALGKVAAGAGQAVIFDATFREKMWRDRAEAVAAAGPAPFEGIWLAADRELRQQRVDRRVRDVSDATADVAAAQEDIEPDAVSWRILS